jgi:cellobiose phosphorylase
LGDHVPYPVEAYPEGDQRHLSAESGLYCRIFTEGLFGIRPTGLHSFDLTPRLPKSWPLMKMRHINAFERDFDITVERVDKKLKITVSDKKKVLVNKVIKDGDTINITLK